MSILNKFKLYNTIVKIKNLKKLEQRNYFLQTQVEWFKNNVDITNLAPATGYLRKHQLDLITFANKFFKETEHLNISPFLIGGNLIGAVRHKGFVPWDDDMDFGVSREDANKIIDFCQKYGVVKSYHGNWSSWNYSELFKYQAQILADNPNKYVLHVDFHLLQLYKGTNPVDAVYIDFFPFDFYKDNYSINEHLRYLKDLSKKKHKINKTTEIIKFLNDERKNNSNISDIQTSIFFPGIDSYIAYGRIDRTKDWLYTDNIFPLQKVSFETEQYWAPKNIEKYLEYECPNYMTFPDDVGINSHEIVKNSDFSKVVPTVNLIIQEDSDIKKLLNLYEYFEKHGIYSIFVYKNKNQHDILENLSARCGKYKIDGCKDIILKPGEKLLVGNETLNFAEDLNIIAQKIRKK